MRYFWAQEGSRRSGAARIAAQHLAAIFIAFLLAQATQVGAATATKAIVEAPDVAAATRLGGTVVVDRGTYAVMAFGGSAAVRAQSAPGVHLRPDFDTIALRRGRIDTRAGAPAPARVLAAPSVPRRLKLVQFSAPPTDADRKQLTDLGVEIVQYVPQNAYLVWTPDDGVAAELTNMRTAGRGLQYAADFRADDALSPKLDTAASSAARADVVVQLFGSSPNLAEDLTAIGKLAAAILAEPVAVLDGRYVNIRVSVSGRSLADLAALSSVVNVEPSVDKRLFDERQGQILAENLDGALQSPSAPGYLSWLAGKGFSTVPTDYPIVAVVDDGVDNGTAAPANSEFYELNNTGLGSRISFAVLPPGSSATGPEGPDGHGNINASIVGGYNSSTGASFEDVPGFNYGLGISPYGRLANVRVFAPIFDAGFGDSSMVDDYYQRGARLSTNSWGADVSGDYDSDSQVYDSLTRDARSGAVGNQELLFVFAAGNAGPGAGTVGSPGTAKNVLTVGASETSNPNASSGDGCGFGLSSGNDARDMAAFSSRGPCTDGRVKPEIVAPGTFIQGAASQPTFNGSGVCGAATNNFMAPGTDALFPPGSLYTWSSGTSHSTPAIAGYTSLVREFLGRVYGVTSPSPALQKAYVIHSGRHITGAGANENLPGNNQGFGIADMANGFSTAAPRFIEDQTTVFANSGEQAVLTGRVANPSEPVRMALVWTDAPGPTIGDAYVNDLDLTVGVGGSTYLGNNLTLGVSHTGGTADTRNNAEVVFLPSGLSGTATITIDARTIADDGVPGNGDPTDQDFALVAYNFSRATPAGYVVFDHTAYPCGATLTISVGDSDLAGTGTLPIAVTTSSGDSETVVLTEEGPSAGVFSGSINSAGGPVSTGDGTLQSDDGVIVTATYDDADNGSGPTTVTDMVPFDCVAPDTQSVNTTNITAIGAEIAVDTDEAASIVIHYGASCGSLTQSSNPTGLATSTTSPLSGLLPETVYYYTVEATDAVGNASIDDNGGLCYSFTTPTAPDYFTELFISDNDLDNRTLTFTPDGSPGGYSVCSTPAAAFPTDPAGGTVLGLTDDSSVHVDLTGGQQVYLYGAAYSSFYVGSNGYLTFAASDVTFTESLAAHFNQPRISALFDDLNPATGGVVTARQLADRVVVTYQNVPEFSTSNQNSFQIELLFDGAIRITYLGISASDGVAGLSTGGGTPPGFIESDLSSYAGCACGNGVIELGESCDDQNTTDGDGCSSLCAIEACFSCTGEPSVCSPIADGSPCNDGDPCTAGETCNAGACLATCKQPDTSDKAFVKVYLGTSASGDRLVWKWIKGSATKGEFGNPLTTSSYHVCVDDSNGPLLRQNIPASSALWRETTTGFKYTDSSASHDGIKRILLKAATGSARIIIKGSGAGLDVNTAPGNYAPPVRVRLGNGSKCWEANYSSHILSQKVQLFKARAD